MLYGNKKHDARSPTCVPPMAEDVEASVDRVSAQFAGLARAARARKRTE